jgi:hypothetical protein
VTQSEYTQKMGRFQVFVLLRLRVRSSIRIPFSNADCAIFVQSFVQERILSSNLSCDKLHTFGPIRKDDAPSIYVQAN